MQIAETGENHVVLEENGAEVTVRMDPTPLGARVTLEGDNCDLVGESPGVYETAPLDPNVKEG